MELAGAASSANDTARPAQYVSFLLARPGSGCVFSSFQIAHSPFHKGWGRFRKGKPNGLLRSLLAIPQRDLSPKLRGFS